MRKVFDYIYYFDPAMDQTAARQVWTVPEGVTQVFVQIWGADGAPGGGGTDRSLVGYTGGARGGEGGKGAYAGTFYPTTPGDNWRVYVGSVGEPGGIQFTTRGGGGGYGGNNGHGGGDAGDGSQYTNRPAASSWGGGGGGGATAINIVSGASGATKFIAGGGGGGAGQACELYGGVLWAAPSASGGDATFAGTGKGGNGGINPDHTTSSFPTVAAQGGGSGVGGAPGWGTGATSGGATRGGNGSAPSIGVAPPTNFASAGAGGGGGGYGGGGGGGQDQIRINQQTGGGGGGAGGSYAPDFLIGGVHSISTTLGLGVDKDTPNGRVIITWDEAPNPPVLIAPADRAIIDVNLPTVFEWHYSQDTTREGAEHELGDPVELVEYFEATDVPGLYKNAPINLRYRVQGSVTWTTIAVVPAGAYTTVASLTRKYVVPKNTFIEGQTYEWQVQTASFSGLMSVWSPSHTFYVSDSIRTVNTVDFSNVQLEVYSALDPAGEKIAVIYNRISPQFLEEFGVGGGSFVLRNDDQILIDNPDVLAYKNIVKVRMGGKIIGAWIIQSKRKVVIGEGESSEEATAYSGPGLLAWFDYARVYPLNNNLAHQSAGTRIFNFSYPAWDTDNFTYDSWFHGEYWKEVYLISPQSSSSNPWGSQWPANWPAGGTGGQNAWWVWSMNSQPNGPWPPIGVVYFRKEFNFYGADQLVRVYASADDRFVAFFDGVEVFSNASSGYQGTDSFEIALTEGRHCLAFRCENFWYWGAGLIVAAMQLQPNTHEDVNTFLYTGDDNDGVNHDSFYFLDSASYISPRTDWQMLAYPDKQSTSARTIEFDESGNPILVTPPVQTKPYTGWSAGSVLKLLFEEAKARGVFQFDVMSLNFDDLYDSYSNPWNIDNDWSVAIGSSYYDLVQKVVEVEDSVWIDPVTYQVNAGYRGTLRTSYNGNNYEVVALYPNSALTSMSIQGDDRSVTSLLVSNPGGVLIEQLTEAGLAQPYRIEGYLTNPENVSDQFGNKIAETVLDKTSKPTSSVTVTFFPHQGIVPWVDFQVGDYLWSVADNKVDRQVRRVMSISVDESEAGIPQFTVELDSIQLEADQATERWLRRLGNSGGSLGGTVANT